MEKMKTQRGSLNLPEITQLWVGGLSLLGTEAGVWATLRPVPHSPCCPCPLQGPQPQEACSAPRLLIWAKSEWPHPRPHSACLGFRTTHCCSFRVQDLGGPGDAGVSLALLSSHFWGPEGQASILEALVGR